MFRVGWRTIPPPMRRLFAISLLVTLLAAGGFTALRDQDLPWGSSQRTPGAEVVETVQAFFAPAAGNSVCGSTGVRAEGAELSSMYTQRVEADGIRVVAPEGVDPRALDEAVVTIEEMFAANDLAETLAELGAYVIVADDTQHVLDLPEFECLSQRADSHLFDHACGLADHAAYPVVAVHELDLLGDPAGPCQGLNVLYHELGHLVQNYALDAETKRVVKDLYEAATSAGRYRRQYAGTNANEYFAEGTQNYFHYGEPGKLRDREWLRDYDPNLYEVLALVYGPVR